MEVVDEFAHGLGWVEDELMQRCSHALFADGRTWLIDPLDAPVVDELASVAGVIQLLDRHERDCAAIAARLGVPHHAIPQQPIEQFEFVPIRMKRRWREVALWWPAEHVLVCADALGTARYFRLFGGRLGLHPFLRLRRPKQLAALTPQVILCGHGRGVLNDAAAALAAAL
ncbi:MAG: hypothetical protein ACJ74A_07685 [Gaiellaceae bacterium]